MIPRTLPVLLSFIAAASTALSALAFVACDTETPTTASLLNDYPAVADGGDPASQTVVYRALYSSTAFVDPIAAGATSAEQRTVPSSDHVYAVLAVGWDPASSAPPTKLVAVRSKGKLDVQRGNLGLIRVSPSTFDGDCVAGSALTQDDADLVTQRIFPGAFAGFTYDAATCKMLSSADGGADATSE